MLELIMQSFVLMLIIAFAVAAIAGNYVRHQERVSVEPARGEAEDFAPREFAPRVFALSAVRAESSKAV